MHRSGLPEFLTFPGCKIVVNGLSFYSIKNRKDKKRRNNDENQKIQQKTGVK
jgi:hypothetical protein